MVVSDLDLRRSGICPDEAHAELVVDPDAVLADSIALECLKPVARRYAQRPERDCGVELIELPLGHAPDRLRAGPSRLPRGTPVEDILRASVYERYDHQDLRRKRPIDLLRL